MNESDDYILPVPLAVSAPCRELRIPLDCAGYRLDQTLARLFPTHSRSRLQSWLKAGRISVDGEQREAKFRVAGGELLHVVEKETPNEKPDAADAAEDIPLSILFEDPSILVMNKPAGLVVHPGSGNWSGTLLNALLHHAPELSGVPRAGIVHRLDKDTSGLMVVARTLEAQTDLIRQLQARTVQRHYLALVHGVPAAAGEISAPIGRHPTQRTRMAVLDSGRPALTRYRVCERFSSSSLVECRLQTGRTHQIRVHMASIGHPLIGDPTYGRRRCGDALLDGFRRQALHAFRLGLRHPVTHQDMVWEAPIPDDFQHLLDRLRGAGGQLAQVGMVSER